jgi:hypothetical protein
MKRFKPLHFWVLYTDQFANDIFIADNMLITSDINKAMKFDERDNMKDKVEYWSLITGYKLKAIELL